MEKRSCLNATSSNIVSYGLGTMSAEVASHKQKVNNSNGCWSFTFDKVFHEMHYIEVKNFGSMFAIATLQITISKSLIVYQRFCFGHEATCYVT